MPEKAIETENLEVPQRSFEIPVTVWVDKEILHDVDLIAAYERMKRSPVCRMIIQEKIRVYKRNPSFKRFLKQLQKTQEEQQDE